MAVLPDLLPMLMVLAGTSAAMPASRALAARRLCPSPVKTIRLMALPAASVQPAGALVPRTRAAALPACLCCCCCCRIPPGGQHHHRHWRRRLLCWPVGRHVPGWWRAQLHLTTCHLALPSSWPLPVFCHLRLLPGLLRLVWPGCPWRLLHGRCRALHHIPAAAARSLRCGCSLPGGAARCGQHSLAGCSLHGACC